MAKIEFTPIKEDDRAPVCPYCEKEIQEVRYFERPGIMKIIRLFVRPHCMKVLGTTVGAL